MKHFLLLIGFFLSSIVLAQSQRVIRGSLTDSSGEPIIGASVIAVGTTVGTVTDFNGAYELTVPDGTTQLQFSYTGFETRIVELGASNVLDVSLTEGILLESAVVTALGIARDKKEIGYSVETLDGQDIQQKAEADVVRSLQGKVAGVNIIGSSSQPGSATRMVIRGNTSFLGNNQALFVVDGIPYDGSTYLNGAFQLTGAGAYGNRLGDLDPNNIESVTILKSTTAAALYGSRASKGVVLITTKTGSNKQREGLRVDLSTGFTAEEIASLPNLQNTYGTGTGFNYATANGSWGHPFPGTKPYAQIDSINHWFRQTNPASYARFRALEDPRVTPRVPYRAYPNNVASLFNTGKMWDNSLTLTTGLGSNGSFVVTASHMNHEGIIPNSSFERTSVSAGGHHKWNSGFRLGSTISFTNSLQQGPAGGAIGSLETSSYMARALYQGRNWDIEGQPFEDPITHESVFFVGRGNADNPHWSAKYNGFNSDVSRTVINLSTGYDIRDLFDIDYRIGMNSYSTEDLDWFRPGSRGANGVGEITQGFNHYEEIESTLMLSKDHRFSESFAIQARLGQNMNQQTVKSQAFIGRQMLDFNIIDIDNTISQVTNGGTFSRERIVGIFGELTFDLNSYAFLTLTGRNDWSSTLPVENRAYFYPSASLSLIFSDALGMDPDGFLNYGKALFNYSQSGRAPSAYLLNPIYYINLGEPDNLTAGLRDIDFPFGGNAGLTLENTVKNPDLKPEFTSTLEAGLELGFLDNRITLDVAVYKTESTDQLSLLSLPSATGYDAFFTNFGKMTTKGAEVTLGITPVQGRDFKWTVSGAFTHYQTVINELFGDVTEIELRPLFGGQIAPVLRIGEEYGVFRGRQSARDANGNLLIDPSNGQAINSDVESIIGNPNPDFTLGIINNFTWKGFTLNAVIDWRQGGDFYSETVNSYLGRGVLASQAVNRELGAVIPGVYGDPETLMPILDENGNTIQNQTMVELNDLYFGTTFGSNAQDEWLVFDATVIRLREISLGYTVPAKALANAPVKGISINLIGRNLWYHAPHFPEDANFDPETNTFGDVNYQGFDFQNLPSVRRYGVTLKLTF